MPYNVPEKVDLERLIDGRFHNTLTIHTKELFHQEHGMDIL